MKRSTLFIIVACLVAICALASCSNSPKSSGGGGSSSDETYYEPSLSVMNFTENYSKSATAPSGTLVYKNSKGAVSTVNIASEDVETNFNNTPGTGKVLIVKYKDASCALNYSVIDVPESLNLEGCYVVDDLTTYEFTAGSKTVLIGVYDNWDGYQNFTGDQPAEEELEYTIGVSSAGFTTIKVGGKTLYPDGKGGLRSYKEGELSEPDFNTFYVSTRKEDNRTITAEQARNKYLVVKFTTDCEMNMWFVDSTEDLAAATAATTKYTVPASEIKFGTIGVFFKDVTVGINKNMKMESLDDFETIRFVSYADENYNGYSYTLKKVED